MCEKIEINRNGNKIEIIPDFEKKGISMKINEKQIYGCSLNSKNQFLNSYKKIGVQLTEEQAEQIRIWRKEFDALQKQEDEIKRSEIKDKTVEMVNFKFNNYMTERYIHTESVSLSNHKDVYSEEGYEIMDALRSLSFEDLDKLGIERKDDIWQEITLTEEDKKFILEQGAKNQAETKKEIEKRETERKEKKEAQEQKAKAKRAEMLEKAKETGEKQIFKTQSVLLDDGNLLFKYTWIHPDGSISTSEFYDGD